MAYRRRPRRQRRRRLGRVVRRRRRYARRVPRRLPSGNMFVKLTKTTTFVHTSGNVSLFSAGVKLNAFDEYNNLSPYFEKCQALKMRIRVFPHQNVSNNSTSTVPLYCVFPWHYKLEGQKLWSNFISCDRARIYRGTMKADRIFNVNAITDVSGAGTRSYNWKPELTKSGGAVDLYSGQVAFQSLPSTVNLTYYYTVIEDLYVLFKNCTVNMAVEPTGGGKSYEEKKKDNDIF